MLIGGAGPPGPPLAPALTQAEDNGIVNPGTLYAAFFILHQLPMQLIPHE